MLSPSSKTSSDKNEMGSKTANVFLLIGLVGSSWSSLRPLYVKTVRSGCDKILLLVLFTYIRQPEESLARSGKLIVDRQKKFNVVFLVCINVNLYGGAKKKHWEKCVEKFRWFWCCFGEFLE